MLEVDVKQTPQARIPQAGNDAWTLLMEAIQKAVVVEIDANIAQIERHRANRNDRQVADIRF